MSRIQRFSDFLEVTGFDNASFAWHLSGMPVDDHYKIVDALKGDMR
jgi:hypothetical protein